MATQYMNIFDEHWKAEMRELLEKAESDPVAYKNLLKNLEKQYEQDTNTRGFVRSMISRIREKVWPKVQVEQNRDSLGVITPDTFKELANQSQKFLANSGNQKKLT